MGSKYTNQDVRGAITRIVEQDTQGKRVVLFAAEVQAVNEAERTCSVLSISDVETLYEGVRLMPDVNDGVLYLPAIGSSVLVAAPPNLPPYILMWSELTKVCFVVNNTSFTMTDGLTQFNSGEYGGIPIVNKILENLNAIKTYVQADLQTAISSGLTAVGAGSAASGPTGAANFNAAMAGKTMTFTDMEDKKVKH